MLCGTITNDVRLLEAPANMTVCALRFTETARKRLEKAGGKCITFDQLAMQAPKGRTFRKVVAFALCPQFLYPQYFIPNASLQ